MAKIIKIFLASSSELSKDRKVFKIEISRKNNILIKKGIYLELIIWEDFLETISVTRLQDEYNKAIKECHIFILLFHTKVGLYSAEEFGVALDSFKAKGKPFLLTYLKDAGINTGDISDDIISLLTFKKRLSKMGHFYSSYKNTEGLLLHFSQQYEKIYDKHLKEETLPIAAEVTIKEESTPPKTKTKRGISHTTISYFTERVDELKEFQEAYDNHNFLSISGTGGIGKTQFTARCVKVCKIPKEKTVWFECEPPTTLDTVINHAGFPEILKGESKRDKEKVLAFIDKINEHKLVLFLEDYHYVQKPFLLADLLKECGTRLTTGKIIVISRNNMVDSSMQPKQVLLKGFKNDDELLNYLTNLKDFFKIKNKCTDEELFELFKKLEGHPFAISLACILIQNEVPISEIIEEIIHGDEGDDSERLLNAIFKRDDATKEEKEFIKLFSAFRGKVSAKDVENIFFKNEIRTARKLHNKNLLVFENQQLSLHPLVREFCYKRLETKTNIHKQISTYYVAQRQELLEVELEDRIFYHLTRAQEHNKISETIVSHGRQFIQQGFTDILENMMSTLETNFVELPDISNIFLGDILEIKGEWDQALTFFKKAIRSSIGNVKIEGLIKTGEIYFRKSEAKKANSYFLDALNEIDKHNQECLKEKARAINDLGLVANYLGTSNDAINFYQSSLKLRETIGDEEGIAICLNNIGSFHNERGNQMEAIVYFEKSLEIYRKIGEKAGTALCYNNIGNAYTRKDNTKKAFPYLEKSLKIYYEIGGKQGVATCFLNIGSAKIENKDYTEGLVDIKKGLRIFKEIGNKSGIAYCYNSIGVAKDALGHKKEALVFWEKGLKIFEEIEEQYGTAHCLQNLGDVYSKSKKTDLACICLLKSFALYKSMNLPDQKSIKLELVKLRKEKKTIFKGDAQKGYNLLSEDLKKEVDMNDILGLPVKAKKTRKK
jgi:tetratricopeptide (TPR) repeat protein